MPIRKYGTEPAKTETREEDNDPETLRTVKKTAQETGWGREPERDNDGGNEQQQP